MLAAFVLHLLANTGQDQQADFEQILLQARILQGEESTYELSKVVWSPDGKWGGYTIREKRLKTGRYLHDRDQMVSLCVVSRDRKTVKKARHRPPVRWNERRSDGLLSHPSPGDRMVARRAAPALLQGLPDGHGRSRGVEPARR